MASPSPTECIQEIPKGDVKEEEPACAEPNQPVYTFPNQPTYADPNGTIRFVQNRIVDYLLKAGPFDMNDLARARHEHGWSKEEEAQFAQLTGYSVGGWMSLSYVSEAKAASMELNTTDPAVAFSQGYAAGLRRAKELIEMQEDGYFEE